MIAVADVVVVTIGDIMAMIALAIMLVVAIVLVLTSWWKNRRKT